MKQVLLLSAQEAQWWRSSGRRWEKADGEAAGPVWVVTDLAEESIGGCKSPRLFGRDRSGFVKRQVQARYPDTTFRGAIPDPDPKDPLGQFAPTRFLMFGVDAADRINAELANVRGELAGVWPISMLMGALGAQRSLPPELFVVMPGTETLRIVFIKNRLPVLTRLTLTPNVARMQVDEIVRTIRHLENTQAVARNQKEFPLLYLGDHQDIEPLLAGARLVPVELSGQNKNGRIDWLGRLFDIVVKSPKGQVAPLSARIGFLSSRIRRIARYLSVAVVLVSLIAASSNLATIYRTIQQRIVVADKTEELDQEITGLNVQIARYGVAPDTVRKAIALAEAELETAPAMEPHIALVAQALSVDPNLRVRELQWRLLSPGPEACVTSLASGSASGAETKQPGSDRRRVEVSFELVVPNSYGPRDHAAALRRVAAAVSGFEGVTVWQDAYREQASGSLRGGSIVSGAPQLIWCITFPAEKPALKGGEARAGK